MAPAANSLRAACRQRSLKRLSARRKDFESLRSAARLKIGRELAELVALFGGGAAGGAAHDQPLDFAARFQQPQLLPDVDLRHQVAALGQDHDQVFAGEPLQRFADRRAADAQPLGQRRFRDRDARAQLQRDDQFLELGVGLVGQRADAVARAASASSPRDGTADAAAGDATAGDAAARPAARLRPRRPRDGRQASTRNSSSVSCGPSSVTRESSIRKRWMIGLSSSLTWSLL